MADQGRRKAAALRYEDGGGAPTLVAAGQGHLADRIVELAREAGVPVRDDPILADALAHLEVGDEVPHDLYMAVAELLIWAWRLDQPNVQP